MGGGRRPQRRGAQAPAGDAELLAAPAGDRRRTPSPPSAGGTCSRASGCRCRWWWCTTSGWCCRAGGRRRAREVRARAACPAGGVAGALPGAAGAVRRDARRIEELGDDAARRRDAGGDPGARHRRHLPALARPLAAAPTIGALPTSAPAYELDRAELARAHDPAWALPFIQRLVRAGARRCSRASQQIELSARCACSACSPIDGAAADLADLFHVVGHGGRRRRRRFLAAAAAVAARDQAPARRAQRFSIDGYASVERRGNVDALLPSELAHDDDVFALKALSDDLLYYGHERQNEVTRPLHYILVDGSASMRGAREVFARGLALALAKKLSLVGGQSADVWVRFFDSRLHPRIDLGRSARRDLPRLLGFRSRARAELRARVRRPGGRGRPPGARRGARRRDHLHHPRRLSDPGRDGARRWRRRRASTASSCCRRGRSSSTTCRSCTGARW